MTTILALETSCDETAVAVVRDRQVLSNAVTSQVELHQPYGGVVPEVACRQHLETLNLVLEEALSQARVFSWESIDGIAATCAPGLIGSLLMGLSAAKTLALVHQKPFLGVHHLEGHIYASYLAEAQLQPPFLCLLVSGGHTSLIQVRGCGDYGILGETRDDAAGEAFDKVARLLGLEYPGGPVIDQLADQGDPGRFNLPEGQVSLPEGGYHPYDTSFSGLKTAVLRLVRKLEATTAAPLPVNDLAASFQNAVARSLTRRALRAAQDYNLETLVVVGGVAANRGLRKHLGSAATTQGVRVLFPHPSLCTDNAAMIACAASDHFDHGHRSSLSLTAQSRLSLTRVMSLYE